MSISRFDIVVVLLFRLVSSAGAVVLLCALLEIYLLFLFSRISFSLAHLLNMF